MGWTCNRRQLLSRNSPLLALNDFQSLLRRSIPGDELEQAVTDGNGLVVDYEQDI